MNTKNRLKRYFICFVLVLIAACTTKGGDSYVINVNGGNDQYVTPDSKVALNASDSSASVIKEGETNKEGVAIKYSWEFVSTPNGSQPVFNDPTIVNPDFIPSEPGTYEIKLTVTVDNNEKSESEIIKIYVEDGNVRPNANAGSDFTTQTGLEVTLDGSNSFDSNGDDLTYIWTLINKPIDSTATISDESIISPKITFDKAGQYQVKLVVNDGSPDSSQDILNIKAIESSTTPISRAGEDSNANLGGVISLSASNSLIPDNGTATFNWYFSSKPNGSSTTLNGANTETPTFSPDRIGSYVVSLIIQGENGDSEVDSVLIVVTDGNNIPVANAGNDRNIIKGERIFVWGGNSYDADDDPLTYLWNIEEKPPGSLSILEGSTNIKTFLTADAVGVYKLKLVVNDGDNDSVEDIVIITVAEPTNNIPIAVPGNDQRVSIAELVGLDGSGSSDADGDLLTYSWVLTKPVDSLATLSNSSDVKPVFTTDVGGEYTLTLTVHDGVAYSIPVSLTVTALTNTKPLANAGQDKRVILGESINLDASLSVDVDEGDSLSYMWRPVSKLDNPALPNPLFTPTSLGEQIFSLTVTDTFGESDEDEVAITVVPPPPVARAGDDREIKLEDSLTLNASLSEGNGLTYLWSPADYLDNPTSPSPIFTPTETGDYLLTLTVTDGYSTTDTDEIKITVVETPCIGECPVVELIDSLDKGKIVSYLFDNNTNDSTANGNDGVLNGAAKVENDVLEIGNNNTDYLSIPFNVMSELGTLSTSLSTSIRINSFNAMNTLLSGARADQFNALIVFYRAGQWVINIDGVEYEFPIDNIITENSWHHILITRKGNIAELYIDGSIVGKINNLPMSVIQVEENGLLIGQEQDSLGGSFDATQSWNGSVENFSIYNRYLTKLDAEELNAGTKASYSTEDELTFCVDVTDAEDGVLTGEDVSWESDLDGFLGFGECVIKKLDAGEHKIIVVATDSDGNSSTSSVNQVINAIPEVTITLPINEAEFESGVIISFQGSAIDLEDGTISNESLTWFSSIDGEIGTGESLSTTLSDGRHVIALEALDNMGVSGNDSIVVCIPKCEIFIDDFELGWGKWYSDSGVWEVGESTSGPGSCYSGSGLCAGTILGGNYPSDTDSRIISPRLDLPEVNNEQILLRFYEWWSFQSADRGYIQISIYEDEAWGAWVNLDSRSLWSSVWQRGRIDLTAYAGKRVRIAFYHYEDWEDKSGIWNNYQSTGWYIDDVEIVYQSIPQLTTLENFEAGWGDWYSDRGVWQVGEATTGPGSCYNNSLTCAATRLDGNYPGDTDSRLISPVIELPSASEGEEVLLRFYEWWSFQSADRGYIQISIYEDEAWGAWVNLDSRSLWSSVWQRGRIDLTVYAGKRVRIAFYHYEDWEDKSGTWNNYQSAGWYIDDVEIVYQSIPQLTTLENFEAGWGDWYSDRGVWQVGEATTGPGSCYNNSLTCAATRLDGNYPGDTDSRLISPVIDLPDVSEGEEILLRFYEWWSFQSADRGYIQISIYENETWGAWTDLDSRSLWSSVWQRGRLNLTTNAGKRVRIAFYHYEDWEDKSGTWNNYQSTGWYIDDVVIEKM